MVGLGAVTTVYGGKIKKPIAQYYVSKELINILYKLSSLDQSDWRVGGYCFPEGILTFVNRVSRRIPNSNILKNDEALKFEAEYLILMMKEDIKKYNLPNNTPVCITAKYKSMSTKSTDIHERVHAYIRLHQLNSSDPGLDGFSEARLITAMNNLTNNKDDSKFILEVSTQFKWSRDGSYTFEEAIARIGEMDWYYRNRSKLSQESVDDLDDKFADYIEFLHMAVQPIQKKFKNIWKFIDYAYQLPIKDVVMTFREIR
jgi:hypothetical protein